MNFVEKIKNFKNKVNNNYLYIERNNDKSF